MKAIANRVSPDINQVMKHLHYTAQAGVQPEHLTDPNFWGGSLHRAGATPGSLISIVDEMGTWFCTALISRCDTSGAQLHVLSGTVVQVPIVKGLAPVANDGLRVVYGGSHSNWQILRPDGTVVKEGYPDQASAHRALGEYRHILRKDQERAEASA